MKRITSFIRRNFATSEKRAMPSSVPLSVSKQKPMTRTIIRKHKNKKHTRKNLFLNKVVFYLLSDSYMYNPLVSPQPTFDFPPPKQISIFSGGQGDMALPIRGNNKKLIEKVADFLEADCYLYSPLITNQHVRFKRRQATPNPGHFETTEAHPHVGHMKHRDTENAELHARPVVMETVAYRESVTHRVRQNYRTKSAQGASIEPESRKLSVD